MSERIVKQVYIITNPVDKDLAMKALYSQLQDQIFTDLIEGEKSGIEMTFILRTVETDEELYSDEV